MVADRVGWGKLLAFLPYGSEYHTTRKLFQQQLSRTQCTTYQDSQLHQAHILLQNLIKTPHDFHSHLTR